MKDKIKFKKTVKSYQETGCHILFRFEDSDYPLGIFKLFLHGDRSIFGSLDCYRKTKKNYSAIEYTSPRTGSEITILMAIGTDYYIG
jgi:hypothetical protein